MPEPESCSDCHSPDSFHCPRCHGVGFVETTPVQCPKCKGNPRGCYQCSVGYLQFAWTECDRCFLYDH